MQLGTEYVKSMKIGDVEFENTFAGNGNLKGLKEQISNFGGIIGQPIIRKANWLIDYPNKILRVSNENLVDKTFENDCTGLQLCFKLFLSHLLPSCCRHRSDRR